MIVAVIHDKRLEAGSGGVQSSKIAFADVDWAQIGEAPFGTDCDIHGNYLHAAPVSELHAAPVSELGAWTNLPPAFVSRTLTGSSTLLMEFPSPARYGDTVLISGLVLGCPLLGTARS